MAVSTEKLLEAGVHFGHLSRKWNPRMAPYIFMEKNGIHIIDLNKTVAKLDEASQALKQIAKSGKKILFVATKKQAKTGTANFLNLLNDAPTFRDAFKDKLDSANRGIKLQEQQQDPLPGGQRGHAGLAVPLGWGGHRR